MPTIASNWTVWVWAILGSVIYIALGYFLIRWIFAIDKNLKIQYMQLEILCKIAQKMGVEEEEINQVIDLYEK